MRSVTYLQPGLLLIIIVFVIAAVRRSRRLSIGATAALLLWTSPPFARIAIGTLERRYPIRDYPAADAQAIVVLGGGISKRDDGQPENLPTQDTYVRARYAAWLYRNWRPLPIVVSGGEVGTEIRVVLAEVARQVIMDAGVPSSMIWLERESQSTYENARFSADLLRAKGIRSIVLVTEAYHMPRSERVFQRAGLRVVAAPCNFRYRQFTGGLEQFVPAAPAIMWNELVLHEWVGLLWYRATGKA